MNKKILNACVTLAFMSPVALLNAQNLVEVSRAAVLSNPEVVSRWHAFEASRGERNAAFGGFLPKVDLAYVYGKESQNDPLQDDRYSRNSTSLMLSQMLYDGFLTYNDVKRLDHTSLVRALELQDSAEIAALDSSRAYYDVLRFRRLIVLAEENYTRHRTVFEQIQGKVSVGAGRKVDLEQVAGRLALAESNLLVETSNLHDVSARFQRIVGVPPSKDMEENDGLFKGIPGDAVEAHKLAQRNHPALRAAIENVRSGQYAAAMRKAAYQPRLDLRLKQEAGDNLNGYLGATDNSVAEVALTWNLFNGLSDMSKVRQAKAETEVAKDLRDKRCRDTRQTLEIAYNDVVKLKEQLTYLDQHQLSIEKARDAYRKQFDIGQRTLLDMLDSENELYQARRAYVNAEHDLLVAFARTHAGMGSLLPTLGATLINQDQLPKFDNWSGEDEAAAQCPAEAIKVYVADKAALKVRALELMNEQQATAPEKPVIAATMSKQTPVPVATPDSMVLAALEQWRTAWAARDAEAYLGSYSADFIPEGGATRDAWMAKRKMALARARDVVLELAEVKTEMQDMERAVSTFRQTYRSSFYQDAVTKKIEWKKTDGRWLIVRESSVIAAPK